MATQVNSMKNQVNLQSFALLIFALVANSALAGDYVPLVRHCKPAVVQIKIQTDEDSASGTGFFISSNGLLMTNAHVISDVR
jgi:S1-C subfamily serine protease